MLSQSLTGKIVSCSGHVKSFLKDFLAESYRGVDVSYVRGRAPVLSIYSGGDLQEEVRLFQFSTLDELHEMMLEKGFALVSDDETADVREKREAAAVAKEEKYLHRIVQKKSRVELAAEGIAEMLAADEARGRQEL